MSAYLQALKDAARRGFYIPEIEIVYFKYNDFRHPYALALDFGY